MTHKEQAEALMAQGYRKVSNKHRIVARIDREDWVQHMATEMRRAPADFYVPGEVHVSGNWCDQYRRVYSKDWIENVDEKVFKFVETSGFDPIGYVPKVTS